MDQSDVKPGSISGYIRDLASSDKARRERAQTMLFRKLYWEHVQNAFFSLGSNERAQSATAEAFGNVFKAAAERRFHTLNDRNDLDRLLANTVRKRVLDRLRRKQREKKKRTYNVTDLMPASADDAESGAFAEQIAVSLITPWHGIVCDELQTEFEASLAPVDRELFERHDLRGESVKEIAAAMNMVEQSVYRRLSKIRDALIEFLHAKIAGLQDGESAQVENNSDEMKGEQS